MTLKAVSIRFSVYYMQSLLDLIAKIECRYADAGTLTDRCPTWVMPFRHHRRRLPIWRITLLLHFAILIISGGFGWT
jgi:hypothetical protein